MNIALPNLASRRATASPVAHGWKCWRRMPIDTRSICGLMLGWSVIVGGGAGIVFAAEAGRTAPNVLLVLTDDQGWGDVRLHGNANIDTPHLDRLARSGVRFDRFFVCPVCAPTRAELLTGRYHPRGGVAGVSRGAERLNLDERTIAQVFKAAGYATAAFGKWHNGTQHPYHPNARGFDEFYGYCSGHWGDYFSPMLEHNGELVRGNGYLVDDFTDRAIEFMERNVNRKFFCYLPLPTPHSPMQVPDKYWDRWQDRTLLSTAGTEGKPEDEDFTRAALAMVECIDDNIGRLMARLDELQLRDKTIVIFLSDNGPNSVRWNGGMRGIKGSTDEGGVRSPFYLSWPGVLPENKLVLQISGAIDLLPTLADLADVPLHGTKPLDGVSLKPLLTGESGSIPNRMLFSHWNQRTSVRTQQFRLDDKGQLFDMLHDPGQQADVSTEFPEVAGELRAHVQRWREEMLPRLKTNRPFTAGHPDYAMTQLPARDADPIGEVERSAPAPNCSYFTNWKAAGDGIEWPVEVLAAGKFEVTVYYGCAESSVGTRLALSQQAGGTVVSMVEKVIEKPHEPPEIGAENDRVPRKSESYVKEFAPLVLGRLELEEGNSKLKLTTPFIQGDGIEVRMLLLRRVP
jgi:arylsulfatase A-like enzyme